MMGRFTRSVSVLMLAAFALMVGCAAHEKQPQSSQLTPGSTMPAFTFALLGSGSMSTAQLRGHAYVLWLMATWCSSCQGGTQAMAKHIAELDSRGVRVVQLEVANDLGYPGPPLGAFHAAVGSAGNAPNWYWGQASPEQTNVLDPGGYPDIYYLVNPNGTIAAVNGAPAATWHEIDTFAARASSDRSS